MKKTVVRLVSLLLAIVLSVCALPLMAFATEADTHDHGACCGENEAVALGICKHLFFTTLSSRSVPYNAKYHKSYEIEIKTCSLCGYTTQRDTGNWWFGAHDWDLYDQFRQCKYCREIQVFAS